MVDAVVSYAIQKIGDAIINEALFQRSVSQQAEELKRELTWMKSFLRDADAKARGGDNRIQNWVKDVREAAYDAEDLIESFAIQGSKPGRGQKRRGIFSNLMPGALIRRYIFGLEIEELKQRLINIKENATEYGLTSLSSDCRERRAVDEVIARRRTVALHASDSSHVVLMEAEKEAILHLLDPEREKRRSVVSIVGMGGLGKTTLAKKVFKDPRIQDGNRFGCAFWINVSQDYQDVKLLKDLLCKISPKRKKKFERMEKTMLERCLHESLQGKTYLIVMDDVWDGEVWRIFGEHLPDEGNGSKVLITTRKREVADAADPDEATRAYELRFLNEEESWELFLSKAIPREEDRSKCTGRLKELGEKMADKCGGLPLALVVMGGLLSQKQPSITEWEKVSKRMVWQYEDEGQNCMRILALSYTDLTYDLKWCFLYLSAFPEDYEIESYRLIGLWIAEGLIAEREDDLMTLEERAEIQLEKLIERSLVQVVNRHPCLGIISCRVHDLLRELSISEAKQIDFMSVKQRTGPLRPEYLRRLSVITEPEETISLLKDAPRLRALLGFNFRSDSATNLSIWNLKLLRVIDLQDANLKVLPEEIGGLVNLRYLSLRDTDIEWLPETIRNLSRLQFLDLRYSSIKEMTSAVWEIETLRQLFFTHFICLTLPNEVQCRWTSLQVLFGAVAGDWMNGSLHKMKDIQNLYLSSIDDERHHAVLSLNLPQFSCLKTLHLQGSFLPRAALTLTGLRQLHTLVLSGSFTKDDEEFELDYQWPAGLTRLHLGERISSSDPLPSLGRLSELRFLDLRLSGRRKETKFRRDEFKQLQELKLSGMHDGLDGQKKMTFEDGAMPRLEILALSFLKGLQSMIVEDRAMPHLQRLELFHLPELETIIVTDRAMPRLHRLGISNCERMQIPERLQDLVDTNSKFFSIGDDLLEVFHNLY